MEIPDSDQIHTLSEGNFIKGCANKNIKDQLIYGEPSLDGNSYSDLPKNTPKSPKKIRPYLERIQKILKTDNPCSSSFNPSNAPRSKPVSAKTGNPITPPTNNNSLSFKALSNAINKHPLGVQHSKRNSLNHSKNQNQHFGSQDLSLGREESVVPLDKVSFKSSNFQTEQAKHFLQLNDVEYKGSFGIQAQHSIKHSRFTQRPPTETDIIEILDGPSKEENFSPPKKINIMKNKSGHNNKKLDKPFNSVYPRRNDNNRRANRISSKNPHCNNNPETDQKLNRLKSIWKLNDFNSKEINFSWGDIDYSDLYMEFYSTNGVSRLKVYRIKENSNSFGLPSRSPLNQKLVLECKDMKKHHINIISNSKFALIENRVASEVFSAQAESRNHLNEIIESFEDFFPGSIINSDRRFNEPGSKISFKSKRNNNSQLSSPDVTKSAMDITKKSSFCPSLVSNPNNIQNGPLNISSANSPTLDLQASSSQDCIIDNNQMYSLPSDVVILPSSSPPPEKVTAPPSLLPTKTYHFRKKPLNSPGLISLKLSETRFPVISSSKNNETSLNDTSCSELPDMTDLFKVDDKKEHKSPYSLRSRQKKIKLDANASDNSMDYVSDIKLSDDHQNVLFIFPFTGIEGVSVFQKDLIRLGPRQFLNDSIIEFYLKYILDKVPLDQKLHIQLLSSFLYNVLENFRDTPDVAFEKVKSWTRKINLLSKRYIIIPINEQVHWYLVIIGRLDRLKDYCEYYKKNSLETKVVPEFEIIKASSYLKPPVCDARDTFRTTDKTVTESKNLACENESPLKETTQHQNEDIELAVKDNFEQMSGQNEAAYPILISDGEEQFNAHETEGQIQPPWIAVLDSLGKQPSNVIRIIRDYIIRYVCETLEINTNDLEPWLFKDPIYVTVPRQKNCFDCGVFLLDFSEYFFNNLEHSENLILKDSNKFTNEKANIKETDLSVSSNEKPAWRVANSIKEKRREIEKLIRDMAEEYKHFTQDIFKESTKFDQMESDVEVLE